MSHPTGNYPLSDNRGETLVAAPRFGSIYVARGKLPTTQLIAVPRALRALKFI